MKVKPDYGDAPIEDKYKKEMLGIARVLENQFNGQLKGQNRHTGWILLVFPFGSVDGRCNYISNGADRSDVIKLLEEQAKRFKEG